MHAIQRATCKGSNRVIRGGSWNNDPTNCRVANRNNNTPDNRNNNAGFRLANTGISSPEGRTLRCAPPCGFLSSSLSCPQVISDLGRKRFQTARLVAPHRANSGPFFWHTHHICTIYTNSGDT
ncbi:MAG: SUMF1/EgtB/PvdO family nonheme iron enzyme [Saprospiraceae bacterium]